ncbi:unnamed protein product [Arctia plantaginis]|uniref:Uncharacterized protein n=1 Tax=Arctia plantaginis TaxID=874455 RepID=A0A8S0ZJA5_ARCPL|nr:unnamed protein product [Arctia plantaginis]
MSHNTSSSTVSGIKDPKPEEPRPTQIRSIKNEDKISIDYLGLDSERADSEEARDWGLTVIQKGSCEEFRSGCTRYCNADRYCQTINHQQHCKSVCLEECKKVVLCSELD